MVLFQLLNLSPLYITLRDIHFSFSTNKTLIVSLIAVTPFKYPPFASLRLCETFIFKSHFQVFLRETVACYHLPPHFILIKKRWIIFLTMFQNMSYHQPAKPTRSIRYFILLQVEVNKCILLFAHHKVNLFGSELSIDTFTFFICSFHS